MTRVKNSLLGCLFAVASIAAIPGSVRAQLPGSTLHAWGSQVWVKFVGFSAAYTNDLYYFSSWGASGQRLFTNHTAAPGDEVQLNVSVNQELIFGIFVNDARRWYYSGDPLRNADNVAHVALSPSGPHTTRVGFEDLWNGGDRDYNDLAFDVVSPPQPTVTPEPISMVLLGSGLLGVGGAAARRRKNRAS